MLSGDMRNEIANRIKEYRIHKKISQEKMAELIGVTYSTYTKIENSYQNVTVKHLINISRVLGIPTDILLFGEVDKENNLNFDDYIKLAKIFKEEDIEDFIDKLQSILKIIKIKK